LESRLVFTQRLSHDHFDDNVREQPMNDTASSQLASFAAALALEAVPADVLARARACIADTVACGVYGARFEWSRAMADYARRYGAGGPCTLFGLADRVHAPVAALANGAAVHAFEQDSLRFPGAGVHPGAALVPVIAAVCEETGASGAVALRAFVAGCEVLCRIGAASHHSSEKLGFHAPGLTGVYGAAVAASVVYGLDAGAIANAVGIAGSMSAGLLAFSKARQGTSVKRLHIGRACEAGVLAARLAQSGWSGPETVLDGRFGYLEVYCRDGDPSLLTAGLGRTWETRTICLKRYACHVTAQAAVQALRELLSEHGIDGADVAGIDLDCPPKVASHHDIREPGDLMQAQYSVPFCLALALFRDPLDPAAFDDGALRDARIAAACHAVRLHPVDALPTSWSSRLRVQLRDGRVFEREAAAFKGMPQEPATPEDERRRFALLCSGLGDRTQTLYEQFGRLEAEPAFPFAGAR
jgi:2-methylcitrate dehydratase PrpD